MGASVARVLLFVPRIYCFRSQTPFWFIITHPEPGGQPATEPTSSQPASQAASEPASQSFLQRYSNICVTRNSEVRNCTETYLTVGLNLNELRQPMLYALRSRVNSVGALARQYKPLEPLHILRRRLWWWTLHVSPEYLGSPPLPRARRGPTYLLDYDLSTTMTDEWKPHGDPDAKGSPTQAPRTSCTSNPATPKRENKSTERSQISHIGVFHVFRFSRVSHDVSCFFTRWCFSRVGVFHAFVFSTF